MKTLIKIGDLVDYGSITCDVTVVDGDRLVIRNIKGNSIYRVSLDEVNLYKRINITPDFCFVCGNKLKGLGLGFLVCSDRKCNSVYLPFLDHNGNQALTLAEDKETGLSYDLPKEK